MIVLLLPFALWAAACGKPAPKKTHPTPPLPPDTAKVVEQNLDQGVVPSPQEVKNGKVAPAKNACEEFRNRLPSDWFQDYVEVPEEPGKPEGRKIRVFYYGKINAGTVPTVFFNGGPTLSSHDYYSLFARHVVSALRAEEKISFVFVDQRGTGCSDPYPQGQDTETLKRLSLYGSLGIVVDAEAVRAKIWAGRRWNVFGHSFGAFVVHRYVAQAPDGIKAAFAFAGVLTQDPYERTKNRLLSQLRINEAYLDRYPEDREALAKLVAYLEPSRCFESPNGDSKACGYEVIDSFNSLLAFNDQWPAIHQWVGTMADARGVSQKGIELFVATHRFTKHSRMSAAAIARKVIDWTDRDVPDFDTAICSRVSKDLRAQGFDLMKAPINECALLFQNPTAAPEELTASVSTLPRSPLKLEQFKAALASHAEIPFYLYAGKNDPRVPIENFEPELKALEGLKNVKYTEFASSGHDGYYMEPRFWKELLSESAAP